MTTHIPAWSHTSPGIVCLCHDEFPLWLSNHPRSHQPRPQAFLVFQSWLRLVIILYLFSLSKACLKSPKREYAAMSYSAKKSAQRCRIPPKRMHAAMSYLPKENVRIEVVFPQWQCTQRCIPPKRMCAAMSFSPKENVRSDVIVPVFTSSYTLSGLRLWLQCTKLQKSRLWYFSAASCWYNCVFINSYFCIQNAGCNMCDWISKNVLRN